MAYNIRWTAVERQQVLEKALELCDQTEMSKLHAIKSAQTLILPKNKQRKFGSHSAAKSELQQLKALLLQPRNKISTPQPAPVAVPVAAPVITTLDTASIEQLVVAITRKIAANLTATVAQEIKELEHAFSIAKHDPTYAVTHVAKPCIVIVGLLKSQEQSIYHEFSNKYSLKFIQADDAKHVDIPAANAYLLMTNFISHAAFAKFQHLKQHVLINGGMSTLRAWFNTKGAEL